MIAIAMELVNLHGGQAAEIQHIASQHIELWCAKLLGHARLTHQPTFARSNPRNCIKRIPRASFRRNTVRQEFHAILPEKIT